MKTRQSIRAAFSTLVLASVLASLPACSTVGRRPSVPEPAPEPEYPGWSFYEQRAFPFDAPPGGGTEAARKLIAATASSRSVATDPEAPRWTSLGPSPEISEGVRSSGRVTEIAFDPQHLDVLFVGAAQGGVWRTLDGGATWKPMMHQECSLAIGAIAIDPVDPDIVYAGTGASVLGTAGFASCGMLRSTDRGETWTRLPASLFPVTVNGEEGPEVGVAPISEILIDPRTAGQPGTNVLLAATYAGLFRSTDGGASFTNVLAGHNGTKRIRALQRDPSDPDILYVAVDVITGDTQTKVFKSVDGGVTWQEASNGLPPGLDGLTRLAIAASSPRTLYLVIADFAPHLFKSVDGADTWTELELQGTGFYCQCSYDLALAVSPSSPNQVFLGGVPLYVSLDGGESWSAATSPHVDYHVLVFNRGRLYAGSDGGVFWTGDRGRTWQQLNTGLEITQFYSVTPHPKDPGIVLGGTQDNGTLIYQGRREWGKLLGGDGGKPLIDPVQWSTVYGSSQYGAGNFSRSDDGGATFHEKTKGLNGSNLSTFIVPVLLGPENPETLLLGTNQVFRSDTRADSWYTLGGNLTDEQGYYSALAMGAGKPERIYAGTSRGLVRLLDGFAWVDRSAGLPRRWVTALELDPADSRIVYVTLSGYKSGHVFKSADTGVGWTNISTGLPDVPVSDILVLDTTPRTLVVGTDLGVYVSRDDGATWDDFRDGLPSAAVTELGIRPDGSLVAATYGRGMFTAPRLPDPEPAPDPTVLRLGSGDRFEVAVTWRTRDGQEGIGQPVRLTVDTGTFWFFNEKNLEVVVKVLDGCGLNERFWVFAGGLTDVEVTMTVTDRETGAGKTYHHAAGKPFAPIQDTSALDVCPAGASGTSSVATAGTSCSPDALCLGEDGRFRVEATWKTPAGQSGVAHGVSLTPDTGYLWFFNPDNVEVMIKSVDGCGLNGRHWVFAGGLTDVEVELRVTDTVTNEVREYRNPARKPFQPIQDTGAFPGCP
jgi:photosystem II stability/assembly factor-like uncharacterized protein